MQKLEQIYDDLSLFPLRKTYGTGMGIARRIADKLPVGRTIIGNEDAGVLSQMIINAKHSDHIEIGTFFGGTAILAALIKKEFGMQGLIHCVDPLDARPDVKPDQAVDVVASKETLFKNAEYFDVADRIILHQFPSRPWPLGSEYRFGTGYIDGDHWNGMPAHDWMALKDMVSYAIAFDDYAIAKPDVISAVQKASNDSNWILARTSGTIAVLRRRD